ncbi:hypothetical protein [Microbacterium sp.]|uniref:hypothetical protein n=1 Tax=Microbacterium sp. TaxID=51671 RepID=UPI002E318029|nr:hypothetical protein [Microbacterium sp.]HEX5728781.1 hypothetical protein [Microbacterium sp.]
METNEGLVEQLGVEECWKLPLTPWIPTLKYRWVRIRPRSITGRRFARAPEPDRYAVFDD